MNDNARMIFSSGHFFGDYFTDKKRCFAELLMGYEPDAFAGVLILYTFVQAIWNYQVA